jgi:antitoxin YefM
MSVIAIKTADLTQNFRQIADSIFKGGETVLISRPRNENLVLITEVEYNALDKARRNAEYLAKLDSALEDTRENGGFVFDITTGKFSDAPVKVNI